MPEVLRVGSLKVFIYPQDHEPPHVHIERNESKAKFEFRSQTWTYYSSIGFTSKALKEITNLLERNHEKIMEVWNECR